MMVNFKLGKEIRSDVINMSRVLDKEKICLPDRD